MSVVQPVFSPEIAKRNGFDFLRLFFAFSVFMAHFGELACVSVWWPVSSAMGVAGFFIISGFLITRSYYRSAGLRDYCRKRIRRIVPAYVLVVVACALLLSFASTLPAQAYFTDKGFYTYLAANLSFLNFLRPVLPGVFADNAYPYINGALWTIKVELALYAFLPLLALFLRRRTGLVLGTVYLLSCLFDRAMSLLYESSGNELYLILERQFLGQIRFFVAGVVLLFYFDFITKRHIRWLLPVAAVIFLLRYFFPGHWMIEPAYPIAFAILIVSFAYYFGKLAVVSRYGDFSYGFYLYHFPVIQCFLCIDWMKNHPAGLFLTCFCTVSALACLSWHLLEKRILRRHAA
ncbi:MAG: acyltransferase [Tannerella sp.]|jgi:peptidoglycan/LPS O-acetylase OafA/YrhL|nr:acyltransferase [Tannerella sp.]